MAARSLLQRVNRLRVTATSPDGTATATFSRRDGIVVALRAGCKRWHSERSLAAEVTAAVSGVLKGYTRAAERVYGRDPKTGAHPELARLLSELVTRAASHDGHVEAERRGETGFELWLRPGTFGALTEPELGAAIASAVVASDREHSTAVTRAHRAGFQPSY